MDRGDGHLEGQFYTLNDALCEPKPLQRPRPPIVVGGFQPKMLRVIARRADEWNMPSHEGPQHWDEVSQRRNEACAEVGRDPAAITGQFRPSCIRESRNRSTRNWICCRSFPNWVASMWY